jgi:hypothetical protein
MAESQETANTNATAATGTSGGSAGVAATTEAAKSKTYTEDEFNAALQRESDRRVSDALKKSQDKLDSIVASKTMDAETKVKAITEEKEKLSQEKAQLEAYSDFSDAAYAAGIRNVKAAYAVARDGEYFDARGRFQIDRFRKDNSEFFSRPATVDAGRGAGGTTTGAGGMNAFIRAAAGR